MPLPKGRDRLATRLSSSLVILVMSGSRFPSSVTGAAGRRPHAWAEAAPPFSPEWRNLHE
jgi:hypothetical protein